MSLVTMFGVSRVPNTLHWMGSQQPRVLDGGRSVVNLLSLVFFAAYCQWHNIILAEWLHFTDIRAESTLLFSDFWWFVQIRANQYPLMSVVPSLAGHGSGRCRDARWLHYRGRGGYCGHQASSDNTFLITMAAHICIYYLIIPSQYGINKWQVTAINIGTGIKYCYTVMALFPFKIRTMKTWSWLLIHILFQQCSGRVLFIFMSLANVDSRREIVMVYGWDWIYYDVCHDIISLYSPHSPHN